MSAARQALLSKPLSKASPVRVFPRLASSALMSAGCHPFGLVLEVRAISLIRM